MARRANGEGSIYRLPNGSWRGTVSVRVGVTLHRRYVVRKRRADVVARMDDLKKELAGGESIDRHSTLGSFLTTWIATYVKTECREHTYNSYEQSVRVHIVPRLGTVKLAKLTPMHIEAFKRQLVDDKAGSIRKGALAGTGGDRARQLCYQVLVRALDYAVYPMRVLTANPCSGVKVPKHTKKKMQPFEAHEMNRIIESAADTRWHAFYALAFGCGLRAGELFGLKWSDIDWTNAKVNIERQALDSRGRVYIAVPKTKASIRVVDIPKSTLSALRDHRAIQFRNGLATDDHVLFPNLKGGLMCRANFYADEWKSRLVKAGNLSHRGLHNTRHTFATLSLLAGVPVAVVSKALGHSSPAITHQVYSHVLPSSEKDAAIAMDRLLG